jgi:hypothetical protein
LYLCMTSDKWIFPHPDGPSTVSINNSHQIEGGWSDEKGQRGHCGRATRQGRLRQIVRTSRYNAEIWSRPRNHVRTNLIWTDSSSLGLAYVGGRKRTNAMARCWVLEPAWGQKIKIKIKIKKCENAKMRKIKSATRRHQIPLIFNRSEEYLPITNAEK